jgi:hypothetical protein
VRGGTIGDRESGIHESSESQQCNADFPMGGFPIGTERALVLNHVGFRNSEARIHVCRIRDHAKSDFPIRQREIIRRVLWV